MVEPGREILKRRIARRKLTHAALAKRLGTTQASVSRYASGDRVPDARARIALLKEMGIPIGAWDI